MNQAEIKRMQTEILSNIAGIVILWILGTKIGEIGVVYFGVALQCFIILWIILSGNISNTLGRGIRSRNTKGQFKNAEKLRKYAFFLQGAISLVGGVLLFVFADIIATHILRMPGCALVLRLLAPTMLFRTTTDVLIGYFQGEGSELAVSVACILRQIFFMGFSMLFTGIFMEYGNKVSQLLQQNSMTAMYGGAGIALAMSFTELFLVLFLGILYRFSKPAYQRKQTDGIKTTDSMMGCIKVLFGSKKANVAILLLHILPIIIGFLIYQSNFEEGVLATEGYANYFLGFLLVSQLLLGFVETMIVPIYHKVIYNMRKEEPRLAKNTFQSGILYTIIYALLPTIMVFSLSKTIASMLPVSNPEQVMGMLRAGAIVILIRSMGYYFSKVLLLQKKQILILVISCLNNLIYLICALCFLKFGNGDISGLIYSEIISQVVFVFLIGFFLSKQQRSGIKVYLRLSIPIIATAITGLLCVLLENGLTVLSLNSPLLLLISLILAFLCYYTILLLTHTIRQQELEDLPTGKLLKALGRVLRVF